MRKISFILLTILITCKNSTQTLEKNDENMDWIVGNWQRINDTEENTTFEDWSKISDSEYQGHGYVKQEGKVVWEEHIKLFKENEDWNFEVSGVNETPTNFKIIKFDESSFISENKENDFPKKISYQLKNGNLEAIISDENKEILFQFEKLIQ